LYNGFRPQRYWFEVVQMSRKCVFLIVTVLPLTTASKSLFFLAIQSAFAWLLFRCKPYDNRDGAILNLLEWAATAAQLQLLSVALFWEVRTDGGWNLGGWDAGNSVDDSFLIFCVILHSLVWAIFLWGLFQNIVVEHLNFKQAVVPQALFRVERLLLRVVPKMRRVFFDQETHFMDISELSRREKRVLKTVLSDALHLYMQSGRPLYASHLITAIRLGIQFHQADRSRYLAYWRKAGIKITAAEREAVVKINTITPNELHHFIMRSEPEIVGSDILGQTEDFFELSMPRFEGQQENLDRSQEEENKQRKEERAREHEQKKKEAEESLKQDHLMAQAKNNQENARCSVNMQEAMKHDSCADFEQRLSDLELLHLLPRFRELDWASYGKFSRVVEHSALKDYRFEEQVLSKLLREDRSKAHLIRRLYKDSVNEDKWNRLLEEEVQLLKQQKELQAELATLRSDGLVLARS